MIVSSGGDMDLEQIWTNMKPGLVAIPGKLAASLIVLLVITVIIRILHSVIDRTMKTRVMSAKVVTTSFRTQTLSSILKSLVSYVLYIFALLYIITQFVGPLGLTLTSIGGVALGFAGQSFIKDIISGIFILMENRYSIGEFIKVGDFQGFVKEIGLRTTVLQDFNGDLNVLPNGNIQEITNVSRNNRRFLVDVTIAGTELIDRAAKGLMEVCEEFKLTHHELIEGPAYTGIVNIRDIGATLRIQGKTDYEHFWNYETDLRRDILQKFKETQIKTGTNLFSEGGMIK